MSEATENFEGFLGGRGYDILAFLTGYGPGYYRRAAMAVPAAPAPLMAHRRSLIFRPTCLTAANGTPFWCDVTQPPT